MYGGGFYQVSTKELHNKQRENIKPTMNMRSLCSLLDAEYGEHEIVPHLGETRTEKGVQKTRKGLVKHGIHESGEGRKWEFYSGVSEGRAVTKMTPRSRKEGIGALEE